MNRTDHRWLLLVGLGLGLTAGCTGGGDSAKVVDTAGDTGDSPETGDTSDTSDTSDTNDTSDTGDTADTGDTSDTGDTGPADACTVALDGSAPYGSIQDAIDDAADGDEIVICPGTYEEALVIDRHAVSLRGRDGFTATTVDAAGRGTTLTITSGQGSDTHITGLTLTGGDTTGEAEPLAGGLHLDHSGPTVDHCLVTGNRGSGAGGVALEESDAQLDFVSILENEGGAGGGLVVYGGAPRLVHLDVAGNTGANGSAGIALGSTDAVLASSVIRENHGASGIVAGLLISGNGLAFNLLIYANDAASSSFAAQVSGGSLYNTILLDNRVEIGLVSDETSAYNLSHGHSVDTAYGGTPRTVGPNDLTVDPRLVDAANADYHLDPYSPGIDAGNPAAAYNDVDGSRNDLGIFGGPEGGF